jgi:hypothetical protein
MQGPRPSKMWSLHASKLRYLITRWHSATSQKNEFLDYTDVTPQNAYMYSSCSKSSSGLPSSFVCFSQNFIFLPNFIWPLYLVSLLSQHYSSSVLLRPLHADHSLFSHSPSLYSSTQCSSHYLLPTTAPHPLCSLFHFSFLNFLLSSTSCVFVLPCHFQRHFVLVIQFSSALHCKSVNTNSRSQLSVWSYIVKHKSEMKSRNITTTWRWGSVILHWVITFIVSWEMRIRNITPPLYIIEQPPNSANVIANMLLRPHLNFTTFSIEKIHNLVGSAPPLSYLASYTPY